MFTFRKPTDTNNLDKAIDKAFLDAESYPTNSPEFAACMTQIDKLYELRHPSLKKEKRKPIDPNTLLLIGANLTGIVVVLGYEHAHVIASKGFGLVNKLRL